MSPPDLRRRPNVRGREENGLRARVSADVKGRPTMARQPKQIGMQGTSGQTTQARKRQVVAPAARRAVETLEGRILFAAFTWDGGGNNNNWTTAANWVGDVAPTGGAAD